MREALAQVFRLETDGIMGVWNYGCMGETNVFVLRTRSHLVIRVSG
jgi:hypothetical protein